MSPGRASPGLTTCRSLVPASAACTQVRTAAQPLPGIRCPACWRAQVTKLAHHGFPGDTPAAARYLSTATPVLAPASRTPSSRLATCRAEAPRRPAPAAAGSEAAGGTSATLATALGGPAGLIARNAPVRACAASAADAFAWGWETARKRSVLEPRAAAGTPAPLGRAAGAPAGASSVPGPPPVAAAPGPDEASSVP